MGQFGFLAPSGYGNITANIILKSLEPLKGKPEIFSVGGFTVIDKKGEEIHFDWDFSRGYREIDENDGCTIIETDLLDFNKELLEGRKVTAKELVDSKITEIFYECFYEEVDETLIPMKVIKFSLNEFHDDDTATAYKFSKEQLEAYDKEYAIYKN